MIRKDRLATSPSCAVARRSSGRCGRDQAQGGRRRDPETAPPDRRTDEPMAGIRNDINALDHYPAATVSSLSMDSITVSRHKHTRFWAVRDAGGELICVCVYKRGALEVARRLAFDSTPAPLTCARIRPRSAENRCERCRNRVKRANSQPSDRNSVLVLPPRFPWTFPLSHPSEALVRSEHDRNRTENNMKNKAEAKKEQAAKDQTAKAKPAKGKRNGTAKTAKESKGEPVDRLPGNLANSRRARAGWLPSCSSRARARMRSPRS